jgi:hypothetical protein
MTRFNPASLAKIGDQRVGHAVGKVVLLAIAGQVVEGQYGDRLDPRRAGDIDGGFPRAGNVQRRTHGRRQLFLELHQINARDFGGERPDHFAIGHADELRADAGAIARGQYHARQDDIDIECGGDLLQVERLTRKLRAEQAGTHHQRFERRQP